MRRFTVLALLLLTACSGSGTALNSGPFGPRPYRQHAVEIGTWLRTVVVPTASGEAWPVAAENPSEVEIGLDRGVTGVLLFFIELHRATGDDGYLPDIRRGADYLSARIRAADASALESNPNSCSLYAGWAGAGYALERTYAAIGDSTYRDAALACMSLIRDAAVETDHGVRWNEQVGIETGSAGTGLFLLYAAQRLQDPAALELAERAAVDLLYRGKRDSTGFRWPGPDGAVDDGFASGGSGVGYFLATLAGATEREEYLQAALHAGEWLKLASAGPEGFALVAPAVSSGDGSMGARESAPGDTMVSYGWAHGSVGAARLFQQLAFLTGDPQWTELVDRCAVGMRVSGIPAVDRPEGSVFGAERSDHGRRSGWAGAAEFFLRLYQNQGEEDALDLAQLLIDEIAEAATVDESGRRWTMESSTPTGYLSGAAGIGLLCLQMDAESITLEWPMALPDDPFGLYSEFDPDRP